MPDKTSINEAFWQNKDVLTEHLRFVLDYNKKVNLTSIDSFDAGILLHVEDSLSALSEVNAAPKGKMADIGSGGGFPGIPLAVASGRDTLLIESVKKKAAALREFLMQATLTHSIAVSDLRSEEVAQQLPETFAVVTARAVGELPSLLELAAPLLQPGGRLIALKANPSEVEMKRAAIATAIVGFKLLSSREFLLSDNLTRRCIITYEKIAEPSTSLPRRPGMATKRPLA